MPRESSPGVFAVDYDRIARCMEVSAATWLEVAERGKRAGLFHWKVAEICRTLAQYAVGEWERKPSAKQAKGDELSKHPDLRRTVIRSRVQNDVRFMGFVPIEVLRIFYDAAKIFVFPSLYEGFGLPPLEAMAHGTPVVTSNTSSLPEVVGNAAVLVNPENVFEIMRALHRVLVDQPLRDKLKARGYEQAKKIFVGCRRATDSPCIPRRVGDAARPPAPGGRSESHFPSRELLNCVSHETGSIRLALRAAVPENSNSCGAVLQQYGCGRLRCSRPCGVSSAWQSSRCAYGGGESRAGDWVRTWALLISELTTSLPHMAAYTLSVTPVPDGLALRIP